MQKNPGYEPMVQAFSGLFSINGYPDRPGVRIGTSVLDLGSARVGGARLHRRAAAAREDRQGLRGRCLAVRDGARPADRALRPLPGERRAARAASERQPGGGDLPGLRYGRRPGDRGRRQRPAVRQVLGRARPSRVGQRSALQDQCRPHRQQGRAGRRGDRDHAPATAARNGWRGCRRSACRARRSTT